MNSRIPLRISSLLLIGTAAIGGYGCQTMNVSGPEGKKLGGIPFYVKKERVQQETLWGNTLYMVTLRVSAIQDDKPVELHTGYRAGRVIVPLNVFFGAEMTELRSAVVALDSTRVPLDELPESLDTLFCKLKKVAEKSVASLRNDSPKLVQQESLVLLSNRIRREVYVDTNAPHYVNGRHPWIGTGKGDFHLNSDMTLSKAETEVEDKTLDTLLSLVPLKEFLTAEWGLAPAAPAPDGTDVAAISPQSGKEQGTINIMKSLFDNKVISSESKVDETARVSVTLEASPSTTIYRLLADGTAGIQEPIELRCVTNPCDRRVRGRIRKQPELITVVSELAELEIVKPKEGSKEPEKKDGNVVTISGTVSLPKAPESGEAGSE